MFEICTISMSSQSQDVARLFVCLRNSLSKARRHGTPNKGVVISAYATFLV